MKHVKFFAADEAGVTTIRYALLISLVALAMGGRLSAEFADVNGVAK